MLSALLFDLDGTLADTDRLHEQAWIEALAAQGIQADHHYYQTHISGGLNPEIAARVLPHLSEEERQAFIENKEGRFRQMAKGILPIPGLGQLWNWAKGQGLKRALVSNAPRDNALHLLVMLGLEFDLVVLAEELSAGKPDPLPYRTALEQLGIAPGRALAFEDSPSGVRSAVAAGIPTVALTTGHQPAALQAVGASLIIRDFSDPDLWNLLRSSV